MRPKRTEHSSLRLLDAVAIGLILALAALAVHHTTAQRLLGACLAPVLIAATWTDLRERRIPNRLLLAAAIWALVLGAIVHPAGVGAQALAALAAGGFMLIFALAYPRGLGMGDVKLVAVMGLYLSASVAVALLAGLLASALAGGYVIIRRGYEQGRRTGLPLAPFLALGGAIAILAGPELVHLYTG